MTNGLSHPYHLDESTFILEFLFLFHYSMNFFKANIASLNRQRNIYKLVKLGQTETLPGQTVVEPPFSGYKRRFTGATILHRGYTGLTPGHTGGLHRARFKDVPGMCRYRPDGIPVVTGLPLCVVPVFPRYLTAFPINILKQPWTWAGSSWISKVVHALPLKWYMYYIHKQRF